MSKVFDKNSNNDPFERILTELINDPEYIFDDPDWEFVYEMIELLSEADIEKNFHHDGTYMFTLLMLAAKIGNIKMAQMLLDKGGKY